MFAVVAAAGSAIAQPSVTSTPKPAKRDHGALALSFHGGATTGAHPAGDDDAYVTAGLGAMATLRWRALLLGATGDFATTNAPGMGSEAHAGLLLGVGGRVAGPVHLQLLGEFGAHRFMDYGDDDRGLGDAIAGIFVGRERIVMDDPKSDTLPYGGVRAGLTLDRWDGFFVGAWAIARHDLRQIDRDFNVNYQECLFFVCKDNFTVERYHVGGNELSLVLAAGAKF